MKRSARFFSLKLWLIFVMALFFLTFVIISASAGEGKPYPPPAGKAWVRSGGKWVMVSAPPNEGPYRWTGNDWARIENIPPGRKWVSPRWDWDNDTWIPGHWKVMRSEDKRQVWISGHWEKNGHWTEGHWEAGKGGPRVSTTTRGSRESIHLAPFGQGLPAYARP